MPARSAWCPVDPIGGARPSRCVGAAAPLSTTRPSASIFIGQTARHRSVPTVRLEPKPWACLAAASWLGFYADRPVSRLVLSLDGVTVSAVYAAQVSGRQHQILHLVTPWWTATPDYDQPEQAGQQRRRSRRSGAATSDLPIHRVRGEHEVDRDAQGSSERPDLAEGRCRLVGLPAADGGDVDAEQVGQLLLGHRRLHAQTKPLELLPIGHIDPPRPSIGIAYVLTR
jgi:hypothetical protein